MPVVCICTFIKTTGNGGREREAASLFLCLNVLCQPLFFPVTYVASAYVSHSRNTNCATQYRVLCRVLKSLVLKVWSWTRQYWDHLGAC